MTHLYELIQQRVTDWRQQGYPTDYPALAEILDYATLPESGVLRFLRAVQFRALETYWYLRLVEGTPHIFDLYTHYFARTTELLDALGLRGEPFSQIVMDEGRDALWQRLRTDEEFVRANSLESVHETLTLDYPSYIFALAMGAGKTMLMGAIVATEFAVALEYPDGPFIQNALVFAPGLTILESLRELAEVPYDQLLPPRLYKPFEATYKLVFTREGEKDLPVVRGSRYNLIVTNTEKIRIQKRPRRTGSLTIMQARLLEEQDQEMANLRLMAVASLPRLGIFSDEAHHTYGRDMSARLKRVRQTVDYLDDKTDVVCVVNTTGTPYYERQPLRDVVIWYGLSEGIRDNILKSLENSIYAYEFDPQGTDQFLAEVVRDFFQTYGYVALPNGAPARLAIYFPQNKDLLDLRPVVERTLIELGQPLDLVLRNTSQSTEAEVADFNRLNDPRSRHRVILLVNKGTEGWDCPSLFACALARELKRSQNFVLQASTRCLRQIPGNPHRARIYLSAENRGALDQQLQETYGETIRDLERTRQDMRTERLVVRKADIPPLVIKKAVQRIVPAVLDGGAALHLTAPELASTATIDREILALAEQAQGESVLATIEDEQVTYEVVGLDLYSAATRLAAVYRLNAWEVYLELKRLYGAGAEVPETHLNALAAQIERETRAYEAEEVQVEEALALIKLDQDGFQREDQDGQVVYIAQINYQVGREHLLLRWQQLAGQNPHDFGFHYDPYNFDSDPEKDFYCQMLAQLDLRPEQVEDIYFTGGLHDPAKTDFLIEYKGIDGRWHPYSPDFLIRRKDGRCLIVEIKAERERAHPIDGENGAKAMAVQRWAGLNPDLLRYEIIFTATDTVAFNRLAAAKEFLQR